MEASSHCSAAQIREFIEFIPIIQGKQGRKRVKYSSSSDMETFSHCSAAQVGEFIEFIPSIQGKQGKERVEYSPTGGVEGFKHYGPSSQKLDLIHHRKRYDVFLSFRGPDVRSTLANKLFRSLQDEGLHVFLDSERLEKGENIGTSLEEAIKDSRVHIPIFSLGYASSAWCLKELSLMWDCKVTCAGTRIIPLFYGVEPCHVRYPESEGSAYVEAFKKHSSKGRHRPEEIEDWKKALYEVSSLSGWALAETAPG